MALQTKTIPQLDLAAEPTDEDEILIARDGGPARRLPYPALKSALAAEGVGAESADVAEAARDAAISARDQAQATVNDLAAYAGAFGDLSTGVNTRLGVDSLFSMAAGTGNTAIGTDALKEATSSSNTAVGEGALRDTSTGEGNVAVGLGAGRANETGDNNVVIGAGAAVLNASGDENVVIGSSALSEATAGAHNVAVGAGALTAYLGDEATAIGHNALVGATGIRNAAVGTVAGGSITTGTRNSFFGYSAGAHAAQKVDAANSMALGDGAYTTADNQIALGDASVTEVVLFGVSQFKAQPSTRDYFFGPAGNKTLAGGANVGVGDLAMLGLTTGTNNVAVGDQAMTAHTSGTGNVAVGSAAMKGSLTCVDCSALGFEALTAATAGVGGTAMGRFSLATTVNAGNNTGYGDSTLRYTTSNGTTQGVQNVAMGYRAMEANTTGNGNVAIGVIAGLGNLTGSSNTFVGYLAGSDAGQKADAVNSMALGHGAFTTADNQVVIGDDNIAQTRMRGLSHVGTIFSTHGPAGGGAHYLAFVPDDFGAGKPRLSIENSAAGKWSIYLYDGVTFGGHELGIQTALLSVDGAVKTAVKTVATLPSAAGQGAGTRNFVSDATATAFGTVVAGGGANGVPVYSDGANWRIG